MSWLTRPVVVYLHILTTLCSSDWVSLQEKWRKISDERGYLRPLLVLVRVPLAFRSVLFKNRLLFPHGRYYTLAYPRFRLLLKVVVSQPVFDQPQNLGVLHLGRQIS